MVLIEFECGFQENIENEEAIFHRESRCPECRELESFKIVELKRTKSAPRKRLTIEAEGEIIYGKKKPETIKGEKETILWVNLTAAVEAFKKLRQERYEKDDIKTFTASFEEAGRLYGELNEAERKEFKSIVIARC